MPAFIDLIGQTFNKLTVLRRAAPRNDRRTWWVCQCECGNICEVRGDHLKSGNTKDCGHKNRSLVGERFGKLSVIKETNKRTANQEKIWECLCDCGQITYVNTASLKNGHTRSCGCVQSFGELEIIQILQENNIPFLKQYPLTTNMGRYYRYDFAILNKDNTISHLIEFDGEQHFKPKPKTSNWKLSLEEQQQIDTEKDKLAEENNLMLIRIPYTKRGSITIHDLMP